MPRSTCRFVKGFVILRAIGADGRGFFTSRGKYSPELNQVQPHKNSALGASWPGGTSVAVAVRTPTWRSL